MTWRPDYVDPAAMRDYEFIDDTVDDVEIAGCVTASSRAIDDTTGRQFGLLAAPEERFYWPVWSDRHGCWMAPIDDLATVTGSLLDGVALEVADLYPRNAVSDGYVWTRLRVSCGDEVSITARWGWPSIPIPVTQACKLQASRFIARRLAPFGIAGSPEAGSEMRLLARLDPDVAVMVGGGYTRKRSAG